MLHDSRATPKRWIPSILESLTLLLSSWAAVLVSVGVVRLALPSGWTEPKGRLAELSPEAMVAGTLASELGLAAMLGGYFWLRRQHRPVLLPLSRPTPRGLLGSLLVVFGITPWADMSAVLVHWHTGETSQAMTAVLGAVRQANGVGLATLFVALAIVPAIVEESLFRGAITAAWHRSRWEAILFPSLLFGVFHMEPQQAAATAVLGLGFGVARVATGSVLPGMVAHGAYNAGVILLMRTVGPAAQPSIPWVGLLCGTLVLGLGLVVLRWDTARVPERAQLDA
ncbi:lysostaphin resistance A-like protein [Myxococcota bacterium]